MRLLHALVVLAALFVSRPAWAWTDARPAGLVTEIAVDRDGGATVTLHVRWRVLAGRFRTFDLADLPSDFPLLEATATDATTGSGVAVTTQSPASGRLEVTLGESNAGGLRRGTIDVTIRYMTSLRAQGAIRRIDAEAVLDLATVPWERGLEATEVRIALPSSAHRARWLADDTPGVEAVVTSEIGRDVVHAIRRHVPAGTRWAARVACDPALFSWLDRPRATQPSGHQTPSRSPAPAVGLGAALALVLGGFALALVRLRKASPAFVLPEFLGLLPVSFTAAGGAIQSLTLIDVPWAVSAGTLIATVGFALGVPRTATPMVHTQAGPARLWSQTRLVGAARESQKGETRVHAWVTAFILLATIAAIIAAVFRSVVLGICAIDLVLLGVATAATLRRVIPGLDFTLLRRVARTWGARLARHGTARLGWRVRGDGQAPESVALQIVPKPGFRLADGVRAFEIVPIWQAGTLRWHGVARLILRADRGGPLEESLRHIATHAGRIETPFGSNQTVFMVDLLGPDRVALRRLEAALAQIVVPATGSRPESPAALATLADDAYGCA